jgi:hypothetical protein
MLLARILLFAFALAEVEPTLALASVRGRRGSVIDAHATIAALVVVTAIRVYARSAVL